MKDFFLFRKLVTPFIVQVLFWASIGVWIFRLVSLHKELKAGSINILGVLVIIFIWPMMIRLYCELVMMLSNINKNIKYLRDKSEEQDRD